MQFPIITLCNLYYQTYWCKAIMRTLPYFLTCLLLPATGYCDWPEYTVDLLTAKQSAIEKMEKDAIASFKVSFEAKPNMTSPLRIASINVTCSEGQRILKVTYPHTTVETIVTQNRIGMYLISGKEKRNDYILRSYETNDKLSSDDTKVKKSMARLLPALQPFTGLPNQSWKDYFDQHPATLISQQVLPDGRLELTCKFSTFSEGKIVLYHPDMPIIVESTLALASPSQFIINTKRTLSIVHTDKLVCSEVIETITERTTNKIAGYSKYTFSEFSFLKSDDSVFEPVNYGIPEQEGRNSTKVSPHLFWLFVAVAALALFFLAGWLLKRRARARAAAATTSAPPKPPAG